MSSDRIAGLEVIAGPMFSGKTETLIARLGHATRRDGQVRAGKPACDANRSWLVSHAGARWPATPLETAEGLLNLAAGADVVGIDEAQFLGDGLVETAEMIGAAGTRFVVAGLDLDFRGEPFGSIPALRERAESVTCLTSTCARCGGVATHSQRLVDGRPAPVDAPVFQVGGQELYEPRCAVCHVVAPARSLVAHASSNR